MGRKRIKGTKYNRVTKQQKYIFLKLCITEKQSIHEAAFNAGIHYSTAKTILFFHKKQYKNYSTYVVTDPNEQPFGAATLQATWVDIPIDVDQDYSDLPRIELIVNSKKKQLEERPKRKDRRDSTGQGNDESEEFQIKIEHEENDFACYAPGKNHYDEVKQQGNDNRNLPQQFGSPQSVKQNNFY